MTPTPILPVAALLEDRALAFLKLEIVAGSALRFARTITNPRIQKPGLALAGYLPYVRPGRLQILGESEFSYLQTFPEEERVERLYRLVALDVPCIVCTKGQLPPLAVLHRCDEVGLPLLTTGAQTSDAIEAISSYLEDALAPRIQRHGVLVEVFSLGTLIVGEPGIGKSECALELIYRGHRLIADDLVVIRRTHNRGLQGGAHDLLHNFLELRGVGIIDVRKHFGMTAVKPVTNISLVIKLVKLSKESLEQEKRWRERMVDRSRPWMSTENLLGIDVPSYTMAVAPGRDVAIMVETAVRKSLLAERGVEDERIFLDSIDRLALSTAQEQPTEDNDDG